MQSWMKWIAGYAVLLAATGAAIAGGRLSAREQAVREQVESSLLVKGSIDIAADGAVLGYQLDKPEALPAAARGLIENAVPHWRFEPVALDPGTTRGRASMRLRLVAKKRGEDRYTVGIRSVQFGRESGDGSVSADRLRPPQYPSPAAYAGLGGTVYLVLKVGRDGRVEDVVAQQVNLRAIDTESAMQRWRDMLERPAVQAARRWTFKVAPDAADAEPYFSVRVPVEFSAPGQKLQREEEWTAYVPGPQRGIPWHPDLAADGADAIAAGEMSRLDLHGPRLLTALDPV